MRCLHWPAARCFRGTTRWPQRLPLPDLAVGPPTWRFLPYTSGTTGLPKGCMHLHSQHHAQRHGQRPVGQRDAENVVLAVVPMFHITGMVSVMHTTIRPAPRWSSCRAGTANWPGG
jgi:fatty-acyl-CoA synthase